jgi:hypothetical protein
MRFPNWTFHGAEAMLGREVAYTQMHPCFVTLGPRKRFSSRTGPPTDNPGLGAEAWAENYIGATSACVANSVVLMS